MTARDDARTKRGPGYQTRRMREWRADGLDKPCRECGQPFDNHGMILLPAAGIPDESRISCPPKVSA